MACVNSQRNCYACEAYYEGGDGWCGGSWQCSGCQDRCERSCESTYEKSCESTCERSCESTCEKSCQSAAQKSCESTCEKSCQSAAQKNTAPTTPGTFIIPTEIRSRNSLTLGWGRSTDKDGNLLGYVLERSVNNGSYSQIYKGSRTSYTDTITYGWTTVSYRVRAYDSYTKYSSYKYSNTANVINNVAPIISGTNTDLGAKTQDFTIPYTINDEQNDRVTVDIYLNKKKVVSAKTVTLKLEYTYLVSLGDLDLGQHEVRIEARDDKGAISTPRVYTFTKANTAPVISGTNRHLGGRSVEFTESFRVTDKDNDNITVTISLNGSQFNEISSAQDQDLTFTIPDEMIQGLELGSENVINIRAEDPNGGVANRRLTFTKSNRPPIIGSQDRDLGNKKAPFSFTYSATDVEKDQMAYRLYLDNKLIKEDLEMVDGKTYTYTIPHMDFIQLPYGKHEFKLEVWDEKTPDDKQYRYYTFTRVSNGLELEIKVTEDSTKPFKVVAVPSGLIAKDADYRVYVCNNYNDSSPKWEIATESATHAGGHAFANSTKTAEFWCIGIKIVIENGDSGDRSIINGIKGWFE